MKLTALVERVQKAEAKVAKKQSTIEKKQAQVEKKYTALTKYIPNPRELSESDYRRICQSSDPHALDVYDLISSIEMLEDDIRRGQNEIKEIEATIEKYRAQIVVESGAEQTYATEVPAVLKSLEASLVEAWDKYDIERRELLRAKKAELGYKAFLQKYSGVDYNLLYTEDEKIHSANAKDAHDMVLDLYNRVHGITGDVTSWAGITSEIGTHGCPVLNGLVIGSNGRARVDSIYAGGWNIQRLHVRVLVHAC